MEEVSFGSTRVHAVHFPEELRGKVHEFFQISGENISPRMAAQCLREADILHAEGPSPCGHGPYTFHREPRASAREMQLAGRDLKALVCRQIARFVGKSPDNVFLFPTGMAASYSGMQLAMRTNGHGSVCLG